jgi:type VI secretion system protein ImpH
MDTTRAADLPSPPRAAPDPMPGLIARPWAWNFYQALRRIECHWRDRPRLGAARRPGDEPVRLGQATELSFAPSSLASAAHDPRSGKPRIQVRFFGLFGPNGPLPLHLTAYARDRQLQRGDETLARFSDLFHHRLLLLFYRAWAQAQPTVSLDRPEDDRFADYVGALIGTGGRDWHRRDAAPAHARLGLAGLLSRQVRTADGLAHLLSAFLGRGVRVESFVGRWMALAVAERTRLVPPKRGRRGSSAAALGAGAVLGASVFDRQHHCRIHVGPLDLKGYESLLPGGRALPALTALVRSYLGDEFGWDLRLALDRTQTPPCRPGREGRLGWTSWLGPPRGHGDPALTLIPTPTPR